MFLILGAYVGGFFIIRMAFRLSAALSQGATGAFTICNRTLEFALDPSISVNLDDVSAFEVVRRPLIFMTHRYLLIRMKEGGERLFPLDFVRESDDQVEKYISSHVGNSN